MLPYALPIALGLVTAAAVVVVLVEVVPRVLDDLERQREREEAERRRRGRVSVPVRASVEQGRTTGVEQGQDEWTYEVRQRKRVGRDHELSPLKPRREQREEEETHQLHVLGSDFEPTDIEDNQNRKLSFTPSPLSSKALTPVPTGTTATSSGAATAPLFSPTLPVDSSSFSASPFLDAPPAARPFFDTDKSRSPTLVPSSNEIPSSSAFSSPSLAFDSPTPSLRGNNPFADPLGLSSFADAKHAASGKTSELHFELHPSDDEADWHSTSEGKATGGNERSPTLNSDAGSSEGGDGWTKLSDASSQAGDSEEEGWAQVSSPPVQKKSVVAVDQRVGLGLRTQ
ncbi:hypothetical protein JCM8547_004059 [Rhodosporidiobolus lusitaniae]